VGRFYLHFETGLTSSHSSSIGYREEEWLLILFLFVCLVDFLVLFFFFWEGGWFFWFFEIGFLCVALAVL
jgi:1,4-dihydroxy-2-naphthoate octaprenyltransferase